MLKDFPLAVTIINAYITNEDDAIEREETERGINMVGKIRLYSSCMRVMHPTRLKGLHPGGCRVGHGKAH